MAAASLRSVPAWKAILAAMLYLTIVVASTYGAFALARGGSFIQSFIAAFPPSLTACALLFACSATFEALTTTGRKTRHETSAVVR